MINDSSARTLRGRRSAGVFGWQRLPAFPISHLGGELAAIALLTPMFLFVAVWNGFPFLFFDSGAYVLEGFARVFVPERSPVYSLFIHYADGRESLWYVAIIQSLLTAIAIVEFARAVWPRTSLWLMLRAGAALSILTSISWFVGQIEPDCFTAVLILAMYPLAFKPQQLGVVRAILLIVVGGIAIGTHPSHLGTSSGLVLCLFAAWIAALIWKRLRLPRPNVVLPAAMVAAGLSLVLLANHSIALHNKGLPDKWFVSRSGSFFLAARLMGDGVVKKTLYDLCPTHPLLLCPYKDNLPKTADNFLWGPESPFNKIGRFYGPKEEYDLIVSHSLTHYPLQSLMPGLLGSLRQYFMVRTGDGVEPQEWVLGPLFRGFMPAQYKDYLTAHQQRGTLRFPAVNVVHVPLALLAQLWLGWVLYRAIKRRRWNLGTLPAFVLLGLLGNAMVCGLFSGPHDRYQSRVAWVPCLIVLLTARQSVERALRRPNLTA
ncbi:hypothetical protein FHS83_003418 [Rhizomicrobium palustre]|uniref:Glycosyltransferase RgtA/B/C/D-like domain-containing protein n=1 Tax=Rhizomicrobium palustre TaxID=189966 RepID=A0A846N4Z9_9PROT|nr:hypothetical protein [Rhizomicrobium palustre]NIK90100.1 hypothetical protein [Rhizomicrobium palustre]